MEHSTILQQGQITIRDAQPAHADAIRAFSDTTHATHTASLPHAFGPDNSHQHALLDAAFNPVTTASGRFRARVLSACIGPDLVGYILIIWNTPTPPDTTGTAFIADIGVFEDWRGQGVGRALLDHVRALMPDMAWDSLSADVWQGNTASHQMFQTAGFHAERTEYRFGTPAPKSKEPAKTGARLSESKTVTVILILLFLALLAYVAR